jgi:NADH-quinone oxidoreductase subunit K
MQAEAVFFWIFSAVLVASALAVISARNPVHSVLFLILAFVNAAGLFLLMGAEFLGMILVVVYVGAVAVLFLFVVMLLDVDFAELKQGFVRYLPIGAADRVVRRRRARLCRAWLEGVARAGGGRRAGRRAVEHRGARPRALHPLLLLLPGGGNDPADRDGRRDRADAAPQAGGQASEHRRAGRPRPGVGGGAAQGRLARRIVKGSSMVIGLTHYLTLAAILFTIGVAGIILNHKNIIVILMSVELILLAVNINLVAFSTHSGDLTGQVFALLVLTVAAAEAAIGLAVLVAYYRNRGSIAVDDINALKG